MLLLAVAHAAPSLTYMSAPTELTSFTPGQVVVAATQQVNLRAGPSTTDAVVEKLPLGAEVRIVERLVRATVLEREDHWYRVDVGGVEGHLFGATLTPVHIRGDLDGVEGDEVVTAGWRSDHQLRLRVGRPDGSEHVDDRTFGGSRRGGVVTARRLEGAGRPVVWVEVDLGAEDMARTTRWVYAYGIRPGGGLVGLGATYGHTYEGGTLGQLAFDGKGRVCSLFNGNSVNVCQDLDGKRVDKVSVEEVLTWPLRLPEAYPPR